MEASQTIESFQLPLEIKELLASSLSYPQILALCSTSRSWSMVCQDDIFWRRLVEERFFLSSLPSQYSSWRSYYGELENYIYTHRFYLTLEICARAPLGKIKEKYQRYFDYNQALLAGKNWKLEKIWPPLIKEWRKNSNYCYRFYYQVLPEKKYFRLQDFLQLYQNWIEALSRIEPAREKYLNYGLGQDYFIENLSSTIS